MKLEIEKKETTDKEDSREKPRAKPRMISKIKLEAQKLIQLALTGVYQVSNENLDQLSSQIVYPPDTELAHVAYPCHQLAKQFKKSPQVIALSTVDFIQKNCQLSQLSHVEAVAGYVNFFVSLEPLYLNFIERAKKESLLQLPPSQAIDNGILDIEYSQPNTHKALHVGHMRNMIYGDAVCNLLQAIGKKVIRTTFPGDMGAHIAKCLWYIQSFKQSEKPSTDQAKWLGRMYVESDEYLKNLAGKPEELAAKTEIGQILRDLENRVGAIYPLYLETREWSLTQMKDVYTWLGIQFDVWYFESECDQESRELVLEKFKDGFFKKSEGAIGLDLSEYDLGFVMYLKSDGTGLYITKDLDLLKKKFSNPQVESSIVVVDNRQKLHFKQLFKTAELMGYPQAKNSIHLAYESVTDENGNAFSSRSLLGIHLEELRKLMTNKVIQSYLEAYRGKWSDQEIQDSAEKIVLGALKYGFLKYDSNRIIKFVLDEWIEMEGDTGPYLQYTYARCQGILDKIEISKDATQVVLETRTEKELLLFLERFSETVFQSAQEHRPSLVCAYLFDLSKLFNRFYNQCPIKTANSMEERNTRLGMVRLVAETIKEGLELLGIPCLKRV